MSSASLPDHLVTWWHPLLSHEEGSSRKAGPSVGPGPPHHTHTHKHTHMHPPWGPGHMVGSEQERGSQCQSAGRQFPPLLAVGPRSPQGFLRVSLLGSLSWKCSPLITDHAQTFPLRPSVIPPLPWSLPEPPPLQAVYSFLLAPLERLPILRTLVCFPDSISWTVCFLFPSVACCLAWCLLNKVDRRSAAFMFQIGETW